MAVFSDLVNLAAPVFLIVSPITSYADQILSMHRQRSSAGFSLDIPLIMLSASILKVFYWPGARFDLSLLVQALVMLAVQTILLRVALDNRAPPPRSSNSDAIEMKLGSRSPNMDAINLNYSSTSRPYGGNSSSSGRPYDFWRWREQQPYWNFLFSLAGGLLALHIFLQPSPSHAKGYTALLGGLGLGIEALLPIPQLWQNYTSQSCKGFRVSVLANWLFGDAMKMAFFFLSEDGKVPWAFKACGIFQALCDLGLGLQYWLYGEGEGVYLDGHLA
jgi:solute carrier family 66, member 2